MNNHPEPLPSIWLASYPKSGNTWIRLTLRALIKWPDVSLSTLTNGFLHGGAFWFWRQFDVDPSDLLPNERNSLRPWIFEQHRLLSKRPLLIKTHEQPVMPDGFPLFDFGTPHLVVYLYRDPRDVAVSYARFMNKSIDKIITLMNDPNGYIGIESGSNMGQAAQYLGTWSDHCRTWLDQPGINVLPLSYEERLANPEKTVRRVLEAAGLTYDEDRIKGALSATQFDVLQKQEAEMPTYLEGAAVPFFHTGRSGTWREHLSSEQARRIESQHGEVMARLGYL